MQLQQNLLLQPLRYFLPHLSQTCMVNCPSQLVTNFGTYSGVDYTPWSSPMSSTEILPGSSLMGTQQFDPTYHYQVGQSSQQRPMYPLNTILPPYGEKYVYSLYPPYSGGLPYGNIL